MSIENITALKAVIKDTTRYNIPDSLKQELHSSIELITSLEIELKLWRSGFLNKRKFDNENSGAFRKDSQDVPN